MDNLIAVIRVGGKRAEVLGAQPKKIGSGFVRLNTGTCVPELVTVEGENVQFIKTPPPSDGVIKMRSTVVEYVVTRYPV